MNQYKLEAKNFELEMDENDHDHNFTPCIKFESEWFKLLPEEGSLQWGELAEAIKNNTEFHINHISVNNGLTTFYVDQHGDGSGCLMKFSLPSELCYDAFVSAAQITSEWMR